MLVFHGGETAANSQSMSDAVGNRSTRCRLDVAFSHCEPAGMNKATWSGRSWTTTKDLASQMRPHHTLRSMTTSPGCQRLGAYNMICLHRGYRRAPLRMWDIPFILTFSHQGRRNYSAHPKVTSVHTTLFLIHHERVFS